MIELVSFCQQDGSRGCARMTLKRWFGKCPDCPCLSPRFVNCEVCQTEGRILTNDGGPDDVDHGVCPECNGARVVEVETQSVTMEDLNGQG
jgi:hypothetical protein